jgi:hypothetical protein
MQAMETLFPGILKAMGPATKEGFFGSAFNLLIIHFSEIRIC